MKLRTVFVTIDRGPEIHGSLLELGPETLAILVDGARTEFPLSSVRRVEREGDSLKNGAIIGAVVLGAWCAAICGQGLNRSSQLFPAIVVNAGVGAVIGALFDADHKGRTRIYPAKR